MQSAVGVRQYVLRDGTTTWHHMEPDVNDRLVVVTETVPR